MKDLSLFFIFLCLQQIIASDVDSLSKVRKTNELLQKQGNVEIIEMKIFSEESEKGKDMSMKTPAHEPDNLAINQLTRINQNSGRDDPKTVLLDLEIEEDDINPEIFETEESGEPNFSVVEDNMLRKAIRNKIDSEEMETAEASIVFPIRKRNKAKRRYVSRRFSRRPNHAHRRYNAPRYHYPRYYYPFYPFYRQSSLYYY